MCCPSEGRPALLAPGPTAGWPADALTQPARQPRRDSAPSACGFQPQFYLLTALWPLGLLPCLNTGTSNSTCPIPSVGTTLRGTRKAPSSPGTQKDGDVLESGAQRLPVTTWRFECRPGRLLCRGALPGQGEASALWNLRMSFYTCSAGPSSPAHFPQVQRGPERGSPTRGPAV